MHDGYSLAPLAPLIGGVVAVGLYRQRLMQESSEPSDAAPAAEGRRVYRYPQGILWPILFFAFGIPVVFFLLPSDVIEAGPLTYVVPSALGAAFFWGGHTASFIGSSSNQTLFGMERFGLPPSISRK
jgi:hypothetical protein